MKVKRQETARSSFVVFLLAGCMVLSGQAFASEPREKSVSWAYSQADPHLLLKLASRFFSQSLILPDSVAGVYSGRSEDVPFAEAFGRILSQLGLESERLGEIEVALPKDQIVRLRKRNRAWKQPKSTASHKSISMFFERIDTNILLHLLSEISGKSFYSTPAANLRLSIMLHERPWDEFLRAVLWTSACGYTEKSKSVRIRKVDDMANGKLPRLTKIERPSGPAANRIRMPGPPGLRSFPAEQYRLLAVIVSEKRAIGLIRTPRASTWLVEPGYALGVCQAKADGQSVCVDQGKIVKLDLEGLVVRETIRGPGGKLETREVVLTLEKKPSPR